MEKTATLTPEEKALADAWDAHVRAEFGLQDVDATLATMSEHPRVNQVPLMIGGEGQAQVREFYTRYLLGYIPPDIELVPVTRTIGQGRLVDELVVRFTHTIPMPWLLPGVPPTGKRAELALVVIVHFEGGKVSQEQFYWDHASLLVQLGFLDPAVLPVVGAEGARAAVDRSIPLNVLIERDPASRKL